MSEQSDKAVVAVTSIKNEEEKTVCGGHIDGGDGGNAVTEAEVDVSDESEDTNNITKVESEAHTATDLDTSDKIDELTSLEREIAILHHVEPTPPSAVQKIIDPKIDEGVLSEDENKERVIFEMQTVNRKVPTYRATTVPETGVKLLHVSFAERLNGQNDNGNNENTCAKRASPLAKEMANSRHNNQTDDEGVLEKDDLIAVLKGIDADSDAKEPLEGVTIEGEGEYQVIEIIEDNEQEGAAGETVETTSNVSVSSNHSNVGNKTKIKEVLSREEERQMALQQIEMLSAANRISKARRRKQDIKPILQPADLITSLVSEWSDDDALLEESLKAKVSQQTSKSQPLQSKQQQRKASTAAKVTSVVVLKEKATSKKADSKEQVALQTLKEDSTVSAAVLPTNPKTTETKKSPIPQETNVPQTTGFRRTRVIKRKIIWDPDAPETQFSYANLVKSSTPATPKKEPVPKKGRQTSLPAKKKESIIEKSGTSAAEAAAPVATYTKTAIVKLNDIAAPSTASLKVQPKRRSETPVPNGNKKKKFSEVDRLLGDEGAVNMLNSLENERSKKSADPTDLPKGRIRNQTPTPEKIQRKDTGVVKGKRTPKPKASESWDYVYKKQAEDSMIIRRRSNSSYSSSASLHRLSLDGPDPSKAKNTTTSITSKATNKTINKSITQASVPQAQAVKQFEFAMPENKNQKNRKSKIPQVTNPLPGDMKKAASKRNVKSPVMADDKALAATAEKESTLPPSSSSSVISTASETDVVLTKVGKVVQILFSTQGAKLQNTFTVKLLDTLSNTLETLADDKNCNVAVLVSDSPHFCQGIDFTDLAIGTPEKRKEAAIQMAKSVKSFLQTLATFPKPLIAAVTGNNSGLGVTMLPLFDVVIGSDKATYETPYAKIGQIPEGYCIWSETTKIRANFKTKLLWLCEKLHSTESALSGLVNKLTSISKVNEDAMNCAKKIAGFSHETYRSMKKNTIESNLENVLTGLEEEHDIMLDQWISSECVDNFKQFINKGHW